ncbi:tol-pal system YbgF family protein [Candidatus Neomarinimicrobiota bacterium]
MRYLLLVLVAISYVTPQEMPEAPDTTDAHTNVYIHEDWSYFAERLRNEFLALGERKYRRGDYQSAVMEYFSFLYHFPEDDLIPLVHYRIGRSYEHLSEYELAREQYNLVQANPDADPRVKVVCIRQLARMDYETGDYQEVLNLDSIRDPYILVLRGFAALAVEDLASSESYFNEAYRYFPPKAQLVLDSLLTDVRAVPEMRYYRGWKRSIANFLPGGGMFYLGATGEGLGYIIGTGTLAIAALTTPNWTRYLMGLGSLGLYTVSFRATRKLMKEKNSTIRSTAIMSIRARYSLNAFWSFAHPSVF